MNRERKKSTVAVIVIALMFLLMGIIEARAAGQQCDFGGDCGLNETCRSVPFSGRETGDKSGICVPKEW